ncbi:MAG: histidine triad nucleotide-binding protein [Ruminococcus sp.]|nr:histidine triad nucleotide-binding protein [Ruminococcus sp.]
MDCLFCKIINGEIPSTKVYEDDFVFAFKDISPIANVHDLVIPKQHICCANEVNSENSVYVAKIFEAIPKIAEAEGIESYRIISNCGDDAGQTVKHLHFHLVGGVKMGWGAESLGKTRPIRRRRF